MWSAASKAVTVLLIVMLFATACNKASKREVSSEAQSSEQKHARATGLRVPDNLPEIARQANVRSSKLLATAGKTTKNPSIRSAIQHPDYCDASAEVFDFRTLKMVSPVKDQGECGACWAFATNAVLESSYLALRKEHISASEQELISCAPTGQFGDRNCAGGWWAFDFLEKPGIESTSQYPYVGSDVDCRSPISVEFRAFVSGYVLDASRVTTVPSDSQLKTAMCKHGPLAVAFNATPTFSDFGWNNHSPSSIFAESDPGKVNHGITLIGWDKDGWLIKNSWGPSWGINGFMRVRYGTNSIGFGAAWTEAWPKDYDPPKAMRALIERSMMTSKKPK
jgi:cathepsin L